MWKCPKCGRTFKNKNQGHYCGKAPETVDEYILAQDEVIRGHLECVRKTLKDSLPDAVEKISWSMPTYWKDHNILHFAAAKKHIGLYPGPEAVAEFAERLDQAGCKYSKARSISHSSIVQASPQSRPVGSDTASPMRRSP